MRISVERGDRAYDPTHSRRVERVELDGREVPMCLTADEEEGLVRHVAAGPDGSPIVVGGELTVLESRGRVRVLLRASDRSWDASRRGEARVQVGREPGTGDVLVQVFSLARPGAIKQMRLHASALPSGDAAVAQKCGAAAGAAAEMLAEQFGDRIDPSEAARAALGEAARMLRDEVELEDGAR